MPANTTHLDYDTHLPVWLRARDVIAGEDAVKAGGVKYLPRLDAQSDAEYLAYKARACFFNATSRTSDGFLGLLFRRDPEVKWSDRHAGEGGALRVFTDDVDLMVTSLFTFCKGVVSEVLALGRCGTLIDWGGSTGGPRGRKEAERAYVVRYAAEDVLNWQTERINGRNVVTLVATAGNGGADPGGGSLSEKIGRAYILHPRGVKFTPAVVAGDSPTNVELENGANWSRVFENKNVRMVAIDHN